jgi:hypothetical protein
MLLTSDELLRLEDSKTEDEWNNICDDVKKARGGSYPPDWYNKVLASGLANRKNKLFTGDDDLIHVQIIKTRNA